MPLQKVKTQYSIKILKASFCIFQKPLEIQACTAKDSQQKDLWEDDKKNVDRKLTTNLPKNIFANFL